MYNSGKLENALAIRDTDPHNSSSIKDARAGSLLFFAQNSLNQAVSVKFQGSFDDTTWVDLDTAVSVPATTGTDFQTLSDPWPYVRSVSTAAVAPASGSLTIHWAWKKNP